MLFRLFLFGFLASVAYSLFYAWRKRQQTPSLKRTEGTPISLESSTHLKKAEALTSKILTVAMAHDRKALEDRIAEVTEELRGQLSVRARILDALNELDPSELEHQLHTAESEAATEKLKRLRAKKMHRTRLNERVQELEGVADRIILDLENLHLALLDASSSQARLSDAQLQELLSPLRQTGQELRHRATAQQELQDLLRENGR